MVRPPAWKAAMPHETISFDDLCQGRQQFDLAREQQGDVPVDGSAVSQQAHQPELPGR